MWIIDVSHIHKCSSYFFCCWLDGLDLKVTFHAFSNTTCVTFQRFPCFCFFRCTRFHCRGHNYSRRLTFPNSTAPHLVSKFPSTKFRILFTVKQLLAFWKNCLRVYLNCNIFFECLKNLKDISGISYPLDAHSDTQEWISPAIKLQEFRNGKI
jgi:hypothetical protein